ncbi:hypothetical protein D9M69_613200 [compost metagenome]
MLVWNAMPSMMAVMSAIWREAASISFMVATACPTTWSPRVAAVCASAASALADCADSAD